MLLWSNASWISRWTSLCRYNCTICGASFTHTQPLNFKYSVYQLFRLVHCTCVYQPNQNAPQISLKGGNIKVTGMEERKWAGCDESRQLGETKKGGVKCLNWTWFTLWDCIHIAWCIITLHLNASLYNSMHGRSYYEPELYSDSCPNDPYLAGQEGTSTLMQVCIWTTLNVPGAGRH